MEEHFEDPSFIYYLIDNMEKAIKDAEGDLQAYLTEVQTKTLKSYLKILKEDMNNQNSLKILKKFQTRFKSKSIRNIKVPDVKKSDQETEFLEHGQETDDKTQVSGTLLNRATLPSVFEIGDGRVNFM